MACRLEKIDEIVFSQPDDEGLECRPPSFRISVNQVVLLVFQLLEFPDFRLFSVVVNCDANVFFLAHYLLIFGKAVVSRVVNPGAGSFLTITSFFSYRAGGCLEYNR